MGDSGRGTARPRCSSELASGGRSSGSEAGATCESRVLPSSEKCEKAVSGAAAARTGEEAADAPQPQRIQQAQGGTLAPTLPLAILTRAGGGRGARGRAPATPQRSGSAPSLLGTSPANSRKASASPAWASRKAAPCS